MKKLTKEEIIERGNKINRNKFKYKFINGYNNVSTKFKVICPKHGSFIQVIKDHINGSGCPKCAIEKNTNKKRNNLINVIERANKVHNYQYDYSLIDEYKNAHHKVNIICPKHGVFIKSFHSHINKKRGCKQCAIDKVTDNKEDFIKKSIIIHGDKYNYDKVIYKNAKTKVIIGCSIHGDFLQRPNDHIYSGNGCPICKESKGERKVRKFLDKHEISYEVQKSFCDLKVKGCLYFDFYLYEYNLCIEYDGLQHFKSVEYWGGDKGLKKRLYYDKLKNEYCKNKDIELLRISYDDDVEMILKRKLKL